IYPRVPPRSLFDGWENEVPKYWDPSEQRQSTCLAIVEVTDACNLNCSYCFASSNNSNSTNPSIDIIENMFKAIVKKCKKPYVVQISGGEPTIRSDLPEIIELAKGIGIDFVQLDTNGIKLAKEDYLKALKKSGLDSIYLSFDGFNRDTLSYIYGVDLLDVKLKVVENCRRVGIPITLVPRVIPNLNIDQIGKIVEFAKRNVGTIKGVHFQPISYFGRTPSAPDLANGYITIPRLLREIEIQTMGEIGMNNFVPTGCSNPHCDTKCFGFVSSGRFIPLTKFRESPLDDEDITKTVREGVCCSWGTIDTGDFQLDEPQETATECGCGGSWLDLARDLTNNTLTISSMHFQDAWDLVTYRVRDCCIHAVLPDGRFVPFCLFNVSDVNGRSPLRELWRNLCRANEVAERVT
ncbi:MAG: radical SAM protein, partial [Candidatus Korarchaeum sp.]|nr:radical SAM protein [Candidatus Korarchaeum sp.]